MVSVRARSMLNTVLVVSGALLIGQYAHLTVVTGQAAPADPIQLGTLATGCLLVGLGYVVGVSPEEELPGREAEGDADAAEEFDPELSPVGEDLDADRRDGE